jgi:hypothetical protein
MAPLAGRQRMEESSAKPGRWVDFLVRTLPAAPMTPIFDGFAIVESYRWHASNPARSPSSSLSVEEERGGDHGPPERFGSAERPAPRTRPLPLANPGERLESQGVTGTRPARSALASSPYPRRGHHYPFDVSIVLATVPRP